MKENFLAIKHQFNFMQGYLESASILLQEKMAQEAIQECIRMGISLVILEEQVKKARNTEKLQMVINDPELLALMKKFKKNETPTQPET